MSNFKSLMSLASNVGDPAEFVGSAFNKGVNGVSVSVDISTLGVQSGDLILVGFMVGEDADQLSFMSMASTGYTELTSRYASSVLDINIKTFGKFADGTETDVVTNGGIIATASVVVIVSIFRYTGSNLPTNEVTGLVVDASDVGQDFISWPEVTGLSLSNILVYFGATGHVAGEPAYVDPTDLEGFISIGASDSEDVTGGFGYKTITQGTSFTANDWVVGGNTTSGSVAYVVFKLS